MGDFFETLLKYSPAFITAAIALATFFETRRGKRVKQIVDEAIEPLIKGRDENKKNIENLTQAVGSIRMDTLRLQMMSLMYRDPKNVDSILKVAETYFVGGGDWYLTSEFKKWAKTQDVEIPDDIWNVIKHEK